MTPPTFTDAELLALSGTLDRLRDEISAAPESGNPNAAGALSDMDYAAIVAALSVVNRLHRWRKWPTLYSDDSYLPAPTLAPVPEPQSLRVQSMTDDELYAAWRGDRITNADYRAECKRRGWAFDFGGQYVAPSRVQS